MNKTILIVEDDNDICRLLTGVLNAQGYIIESAHNGVDGLLMAKTRDYALILLDLMLPLKTGEEVLRPLRESKNTPVIVLSARDSVYSRIQLLRLGADDYLTKPFDIDELALRVAAVLRRLQPDFGKCDRLQFRDILIDNSAKRVFVSDHEVILTAMEYAILEVMLEHPGQIFSKARLFETVCREDYISGDNTIHVHISNIRKKLGSVSDSEYIETVYGMGYRLIDAPENA